MVAWMLGKRRDNGDSEVGLGRQFFETKFWEKLKGLSPSSPAETRFNVD
jgi:hypothetical protein